MPTDDLSNTQHFFSPMDAEGRVTVVDRWVPCAYASMEGGMRAEEHVWLLAADSQVYILCCLLFMLVQRSFLFTYLNARGCVTVVESVSVTSCAHCSEGGHEESSTCLAAGSGLTVHSFCMV